MARDSHRDGVEHVSEDDVVRHWLRTERENPETVEGLTDAEALTSLMHNMPGPSAYIWQYRPAEWYRITLNRKEFERLRPVPSPDNHTWDALCQGGTIMDGAERIRKEDDEYLKEETHVDVAKIQAYQERIRHETDLPELVIGKRRSCRRPRVLDGNHRAMALALHTLKTDTYIPIDAYVGIGANPFFRPFFENVCFAIREFLYGKREVLF